MRLDRALLPLLALVGFSFAQDTNFSAGPQYLVTTGSPMLLRPIVTPSLSLGETQPVAASAIASAMARSTDGIDIRPFHLLQQLPSVGGERF